MQQNTKHNCKKTKLQADKQGIDSQELPAGMCTFSLTLWKIHQTLDIPGGSQQKMMIYSFIGIKW